MTAGLRSRSSSPACRHISKPNRSGSNDHFRQIDKMKPKTINDLPPDKPLGGVVFLHPETGERREWASQWQKGVWYKKPGDKSDQVFPLFLNDLTEAFKLELAP